MKKFLEQFGIKNLFDQTKLRVIGGITYSVNERVQRIIKQVKLPPLAAGMCLGKFNTKNKPSIDLLHALSKTKAKKAFVNEKGEWMFICKRPVLKKNIVSNQAKKGEKVLVLNKHKECIGYGTFDGKKIKNEYDIGDFLRRERA